MELAGTKRSGLTAACTLSVLSSLFRIVPYFTIYSILKELISCYSSDGRFTFGDVRPIVLITAASAVLYGVCAYASAMLSHGAAFDILYELRMKLMDKMGRISSGYYTSNTQGSIKKLLMEDVEQIEVFIAHSMCEVAAAVATPLFTIIVLFIVDWRLTLVSLLPIMLSFIISGGEKQRISIARAILFDAPIVFLDEATASLDPENEVLIQRAIDELVKNKTVLVIAHRLQSVMGLDNIIVIDGGKIVEQGTHEQLLQKGGRYAALWREQQTAGSWKL